MRVTFGRGDGGATSGRGRVLTAGLLLAMAAPASAGAQQATGDQPAAVLTLQEAVATSLERNLGLENARWGLEAAQSQAREAWGNIFPTANFNASWTRNLDIPVMFLPAEFMGGEPGDVVPIRVGTENSWFAQLRADQPLFNAAAFLGVGAAGRFETLQQEVVRGQAHQVVTDARLRYYGVLLAQEQLRLTENSVARVEQVLAETRSLGRAGLASEYDVLRLEVELANLQPNLARADNAFDAARRALAVSMGVESLEGVELAGSLLELELPPLPGARPVLASADAARSGGATLALERAVRPETLPAAEAIRLARENRSDLRQLELTRELRETERRVEVSQYLPRISVFGTWTAQGQGDDMTFFGENNFNAKAVGLEVSVPVFSGFQRPARVGRMRAVVEQVEAQLDLATELADNEVTTLLEQAREAYDRAAAQRRAVEQATRGFEIARAEFTNGLGSRLQLTDAELALRQSEFNYAQAVYDYLTTTARLDAAVGVVPMVDAGDVVALQG